MVANEENEMFTNLIERNKAKKILKKFKDKFVVSDYNPQNQSVSRLLWCNLSCAGESIPINEFEKINVEKNAIVFFYDERANKMFQVKYYEVADYIINLEPWDEYDAYIFDDTFKWFIAITHEDFCILYGL